MSARTLLIGNGLNRTLDGSCSWVKLMQNLGGDMWSEAFADVPSPIQYEVLAARHNRRIGRRGADTYLQTKRRVADLVSAIQIGDGCVHNRLRTLEIDNVITTNYDLSLERALSFGDFVQPNIMQSKYLFESTSEINRVKIFHAHGIVTKPQSICIGYEHYCGYIQRMRQSLLDSAQAEEDSSSKLEKLVLDGEVATTWPGLFFTSDIDIIGFGLDFSEIDFWWLLSLRAAFFTGSDPALSGRGNRIRFFELINAEERHNGRTSTCDTKAITSVKKAALDGLDVDYVPVPLKGGGGDSFRRGYEEIFDRIAAEMRY